MHLVLLSLLACGGAEAPKEATPKTEGADACALSFDTLDATSWVFLNPGLPGGEKPDPRGRIRFSGTSGNLTAKGTAGADVDMFDYSCAVSGSTATCLETATHVDAFCKAWAATHDGVCDPAAVAAATGIPQAEVEKAAEGVNKMLKGLNKAQTEVQRREDNRSQNKIRLKFLVAIDKTKCDLVVQDKYLTMVDGKMMELSNPIEGHFVKAKEDYTFEGCKDPAAAWAGEGAQHELNQPAGPVRFRAGLSRDQKADKACTYSAAVYKDWVKLADVPGKADPKLGVLFETAVSLTEKGPHFVYFERTKTCGGATEPLGIACNAVRIE